ncbi:hypothetical protein M5689_022772 [Euphorbia peplus]|nr:hypothetical protein M5689_022772 [Euphorbia peplus]
MSRLLPEAKVQVQSIEASKLPSGSYRARGFHQGRFQAFEVFGDSEIHGNNQLNWTNLFLLNKLGHRTLSSADINAISQLSSLTTVADEALLKELKALAKHMSDEFAGIQEEMLRITTDSDLEKVKESIKGALSHAELGGRLSMIEAKLDRVEKLLNEIANRMVEH